MFKQFDDACVVVDAVRRNAVAADTAGGAIQKCFDPVAKWSVVPTAPAGSAPYCGHPIAEEASELLPERVRPFLQS